LFILYDLVLSSFPSNGLMLCVFIYTHLFILVVYDRCWRYLYLLTLVFVALFELALLGYLGIFATELLISPFTLPVIRYVDIYK
jgi:hypothetical protein